MILPARPTRLEAVTRSSEALPHFFSNVDTITLGLNVKKIRKMGGRAVDAKEVFFRN